MDQLTWTSHPLKEAPLPKTLSLILIITIVTCIVGWSFESRGFALVSLILLTTAMSRYFCPTHYALDAESITVSHLGIKKQYQWVDFHRADRHPDGIFISPFIKPNRLDTFRGQFLRTAHPDELYHVIRRHIQNDAP